MNQITKLSDDVNVISAEINSYKQIAGQAVFEIGRRLKYVKEAKLAESRGGWQKWCESEIGMDRTQADKFVKVYAELGGNECTYTQNGLRALYEIATIPEGERNKPQVVPSTGEIKTVDEMTTRELREVKRSLHQAEQEKSEAERRASQAESNAHHWEQVAKRAQNLPPRIETKTVEVIPKQTQQEIEKLRFENSNLRHGYQTAKEKLQSYESRDHIDFNEKEAEVQRKKLQSEAELSTIGLRVTFKRFIEEGCISSYLYGAIAHASEGEKKHLSEMVELAEKVIRDTKLALTGRKLGEINEQ